jgi:MarR family transcriptional regulator for hemolysin
MAVYVQPGQRRTGDGDAGARGYPMAACEGVPRRDVRRTYSRRRGAPVGVLPIPKPPGPPPQQPIGVLLARTGKALDRAFDEALAAAGGNRPTWLVLLAVKFRAGRTQSGIADGIGVSGSTITHQLNRLEAAGLVVRARDPANRRLQTITLTADGDALFFRLRDAALAFDRRLRSGIGDVEIAGLRQLLNALHDNVTTDPAPQFDPI